jgi:hypothetical protein
MANREEALRRIFEATGVDARLTDDQKRELLAHLEDAVEKKVGAGVPEMDAVGQAFQELGDLQKIARDFPSKPPAAVTPEGLRILADGRAYAWMAFCFLAFFTVMGWFVTPRFTEIFRQVRVPLPTLTRLFLTVSDAFRSLPGMAVLSVLLVGVLLVLVKRIRLPQPVIFLSLFVSVGLCVGLVVCLFLPLVSLLEGIGVGRR